MLTVSVAMWATEKMLIAVMLVVLVLLVIRKFQKGAANAAGFGDVDCYHDLADESVP